MSQRADVDQRARVNVDGAAAEEAEFLKPDAGRGLDAPPRKLLKKSIDAHRSRGNDGAVTVEDKWREERRVCQRGPCYRDNIQFEPQNRQWGRFGTLIKTVYPTRIKLLQATAKEIAGWMINSGTGVHRAGRSGP